MAAFPPDQGAEHVTAEMSQLPASPTPVTSGRLGVRLLLQSSTGPQLPQDSCASVAGLNSIFSRIFYEPFGTLCVRWDMLRGLQKRALWVCFSTTTFAFQGNTLNNTHCYLP